VVGGCYHVGGDGGPGGGGGGGHLGGEGGEEHGGHPEILPNLQRPAQVEEDKRHLEQEAGVRSQLGKRQFSRSAVVGCQVTGGPVVQWQLRVSADRWSGGPVADVRCQVTGGPVVQWQL